MIIKKIKDLKLLMQIWVYIKNRYNKNKKINQIYNNSIQININKINKTIINKYLNKFYKIVYQIAIMIH